MGKPHLKRTFLFSATLILLAMLMVPMIAASPSVAAMPVGWYAQDSGVTEDLNAVEAVDAFTAWVVGDNGTIIKTTDGGDNWLPQESGTSLNLTDVSAVSGNTAWVVGGDGVVDGAFIVLRTIDGGETWDAVAKGAGYLLSEITAVDAEIAWVAGAKGVISKTMNSGGTWYLQTAGTANTISDIKAVDADTAYAMGGKIFKTTNGGWAWTAQTDPVTQLGYQVTWTVVEAIDANNIWVLGDYLYDAGPFSFTVGIYLRSSDGCATWYPPLLGQYGFSTGVDISAPDASTAWVVGTQSSSGNISKTSNGGVTWACPQTFDPMVDLYDVSAANSDVAWAIGTGGTIIHTVNGGFALPAPYVASINPSSGTAGSIEPVQVTITGSGFGASRGFSSAVAFGPWSIVNVDSWSDTEITFTLDPSIFVNSPPGPYEVTVTTAGGTSNVAIFTLVDGFAVHSISPNSGIQFTLLMDVSNLAGTGFEPGATVRLENASGVVNALSVNVISPVQIAFNMSLFGAQPGAYDVVVTNPDGSEARLESGFTVNSPCGAGGGTAVLMLGLVMGLVSLAGAGRLFRRRK